MSIIKGGAEGWWGTTDVSVPPCSESCKEGDELSAERGEELDPAQSLPYNEERPGLELPSVKPSPTLLFAVAVLVVLVVLAAPIPAPAVQVPAV
ncbi:hypothetical protein JCM24511_08247 [Saitozyma sp. JCM 24511]|nr:hypothetical protein JCM24511_08247 [Saitozyma sp. JCM 24511]